VNKIIIYITIGYALTACTSSLTKKEYVKWIETPENGLKKNKTVEGFYYEIQYKPVAYIVIKKNSDSITVKDYEALHYIDLELSHKDFPELMKLGLEQQEDYYHRLKYYSFDIQNDLTLIDGQDTMKCVFSHFERTYGILPYIKIVAAFEKSKKQGGDKTFSYTDKIFNKGIINLKIKEKALKNIPKIII
jgi:hypothetical protein